MKKQDTIVHPQTKQTFNFVFLKKGHQEKAGVLATGIGEAWELAKARCDNKGFTLLRVYDPRRPQIVRG